MAVVNIIDRDEKLYLVTFEIVKNWESSEPPVFQERYFIAKDFSSLLRDVADYIPAWVTSISFRQVAHNIDRVSDG